MLFSRTVAVLGFLAGMGASAGTGPTTVSAGTQHTCALDSGGSIWCWGLGGWWGAGESGSSSLPVQAMLGVAPAVEVSTGIRSTCARKGDGTVWCAGENRGGELGDGTETFRSLPVQVAGLSNAIQLVTGARYGCALRSDRTVVCWGDTNITHCNYSCPGFGLPLEVPGLSDVVELAAGATHACALRGDGTLWCWGRNFRGLLGDGTEEPRRTPVQVAALGNRVTRVVAGRAHTCALDVEGAVWCWGDDSDGQLGQPGVWRGDVDPHVAWVCIPLVGCTHYSVGMPLGQPVPYSVLPVRVALEKPATALFSGSLSAHTCARDVEGTVRCWGNNEYGQLGQGTFRNTVREPGPVASQEGWRQVASGALHTCATGADGRVWCWGSDDGGQLGDGSGLAADCTLVDPPTFLVGAEPICLQTRPKPVDAFHP